jgi:hypothetical protein
MASFSCRFLGADGAALQSEELAAQTVYDALIEARHMFALRPYYPIFELVEGEHVLHFESRPAHSH